MNEETIFIAYIVGLWLAALGLFLWLRRVNRREAEESRQLRDLARGGVMPKGDCYAGEFGEIERKYRSTRERS